MYSCVLSYLLSFRIYGQGCSELESSTNEGPDNALGTGAVCLPAGTEKFLIARYVRAEHCVLFKRWKGEF
jgi:hypothetical protein